MALDSTKPAPVEVIGTILHETASAILFEVEGTGIWFPLSTVHEIHRTNTVDGDKITVEQWIAHRKGLC
jgi:gentisate 1,2-dioxygenase